MSFKKKILVVDLEYKNKSRFIPFFLYLLKAFREENYDLSLFRLGNSLKGKKKSIKDLTIKDFSNYKNSNLLEILNNENPDLVLVLHMNNLDIRSLNRCCKYLNIPVMFLEHAITSNVELTNTKRHDSKRFLLKRFKRIIKDKLFNQYFNYIKYLFLTKASIKTFFLFFIESIFKLLNKDLPSEDWNYAAYCVFIDPDKRKLLLQHYNFIDENKIHVVGNYDLLEFGMSPELFNSYVLNNISKDILYIDSDCVYRTFNGNKALYLKYIRNLNKIIEDNGFKLNIKLHPLSIEKLLDIELSKYNINIVEQNNFMNTLEKVKYVISEASSITTLPCLIGLPLLTPTLNPFNKKKYGTLINNYPNRLSFSSLKELDFIFKNHNLKSFKNQIDFWIREYAGPLPSDNFPKRVLEIIKNII
tara:strand:+ start:5772 stop:7019 length:1248 start_codon:yes stop_codon:yes gene_type:complete